MSSSKRILIVDDNEEFRFTLTASLRKLGYAVEDAEGAEAAFVKLHEFDPDVVLLDLCMSGTSGSDAIEVIKEMNPKAAVIIITGVLDEAARQACLDRGAHTVLYKPLDLGELQVTVNNAIERTGETS